ncbi:MAG: hypothetical protein PHU25_00220 [Deltaproteobacteria bacterium]|nr:hypothetical protein [Deltaproteobacteria bacterium]
MPPQIAVALLLAVAFVATPARAPAGELMRFGPAAVPEAHSDYGGTPDPPVSPEMGLSPVEIRAILARFASTGPGERRRALEALRRDADGSERAFREVLWGRHGAANAEMRGAVKDAERRAPGSGRDKGDALAGLLASSASDRGTTTALGIAAVLRVLADLDTLAGYKVLIEFSPRHAGVFRREVGRLLVSKGLPAMPALVYGRGSKNPEIHLFCVEWIRDMGEPLLGEQIKLKNPRRLAQLLEAYASVNDLDAIDVTLSLANHESVFVRNAARKCIEAYGVNAKWSVRREYENTFGRTLPDSADTVAMFAELCRRWDEKRLSGPAEIFARGLAQRAAGRLDEMAKDFRLVLRDAPLFARRGEMAEGFLSHAAALDAAGRTREAREAILVARRVAPAGSPEWRKAEARLKWLLAEQMRAAGAASPELYRQVLALDPGLEDAASRLARLTGAKPRPADVAIKGAFVAVFVFLAALLVVRRLGAP